MSICGGSAPSPDPLIGQAAKANAQTAEEALNWYKDLYNNELLPMAKQNQALSTQLIGKYLSSMDKQQQFADEQNAYYNSTFKPLEQQMVRDAQNYDSQSNIDRRAGIAGANVEQAYSGAQQQNARDLSRYGLNPNSSAFAQTNERLMRDSALAKAGAQTGAAFDTMDKAIALRAGAANFGRNMPNTAATYYGNANAAGGQAMGASQSAMAGMTGAAGAMGQGFNTSINGYNSAGNLAIGDFQTRMQGYQANQSGLGGMFGGFGTLLGMSKTAGGASGLGIFLADGGEVPKRDGAIRGPGGPVDDKIPAMLSDGEYVIPADVVKAKGVEFFDKLKAKYHTPAAVQRQAIQRG